jgi:hypothetical protein
MTVNPKLINLDEVPSLIVHSNMADTKAHRDAEDWICEDYLPRKFNQRFSRKRLKLRWGGKFDFDAVNEDNTWVISISASGGITSGGKIPTAKLHKIRADALFLLMVDVKRRMMVFTDQAMLNLIQKEIGAGRFPPEIEILHVELPLELEGAVKAARKIAAQEVTRHTLPD